VKRSSSIFLLFLAHGLAAQILDDSTKLVYGPNTTQYIFEDNIKYNDLFFVPVDTSMFNIHRFTTTELSGYLLQDLGTLGTATRNLYPTPPSIIGVRSGFYVYEPFFKPPEDFKYYDTKSPYSRIGAAVGGRGRSRVDVGFNRSDSTNFNIGLDYNRIVADKQVSSIGRNDRLTDSEGYDIYAVYFTPNRKYLALANFSRNRTTVTDQGGIDTTNSFGYFDRDAAVFLQNAKSEYLRRNLHFYQQLSIDSALQFYQTFDRSFAAARFRNENLKEDENYFDNYYFSTDTTNEENTFLTNTLETGVKGSLGKLFYLGYYKIRGYDFVYGKGDSDTLNFRDLKPETKGVEHYVGGMVRVQLNRNYRLTGTIEFNLNGNQRLTGDLLAKNFDVHFVTQQYAPSFMDKAYLGNHDFWVNDFKNIKALQVEGGYLQRIGRSNFRPKLNFTTFTDYIYYDTLAMPRQTNGTTTILRPGLDYSFNFFNHFYISGNVEYALVSGNTTEAFPVPDMMVNLNVFYSNLFFGDNLEVQVGLDNHWKSDYYAPDYRVSTQQYFIQNYFEVPSFLITDFYLNIKLGHAYVFAKMNNLVQAITQEGYFAAPNYVGKRPLFDFGFYWMFFD